MKNDCRVNVKVYQGADSKLTSTTVTFFDVTKIVPSKDFDSYEYELFLKFATLVELEGDFCTSETFTKIEGYKIQGLKPRVSVVEDEELNEILDYAYRCYENELGQIRYWHSSLSFEATDAL